jgi:uncharacterized lipoprotein YddW (UPF0748 family)
MILQNTLISSAVTILILAGRAGVHAAEPADLAEIDRFNYGDTAAAQAQWQPMGGSGPVSVVERDGRNVLRLPCDFAGTRTERGSWDRKVDLDLSSCRGVRFELWCADASPVSYFSIYFQSGGGWFHGMFYPETAGAWNIIEVSKASMVVEGTPAGWGRISTIRLSAWRGQDANTEVFVRDLRKTGVLGSDAAVAVVRGDFAAQRLPEEARTISRSADGVARVFEEAGIGAAILSDLDLSAAVLAKGRIVVLPYNPSMPEKAEAALVSHIRSGGKVLAFYQLPEKVRAALGMPANRHVRAGSAGQFARIRFRDGALAGAPAFAAQRSWNINAVEPKDGVTVLADWQDDKGQDAGYPAVVASSNGVFMTHVLLPGGGANQERMLLAMAGRLAPELWREAGKAALAGIGTFGGFKSHREAIARIETLSSRNSAVADKLREAGRLRDSAENRMAEAQFSDALDQAKAAGRLLLEAYCMAQEPVPGEFRAFWCHSAFGVEGIDWDEAIRRLAANGFTAILPNMLWGGVAYYPSKLLPVSSQVAERGDQIAKCLEACRRHGLQVHVWKVNWNLGSGAPKEFRDLMRQQGRLQADAQGKEEPWLCPSHPDNQKLEIDSMVEVARSYAVDGIHFDYIRYPDGDHCYCAGCRARFERAAGQAVSRWPQDVLRGAPLQPRWLEWRRGNITTVVKAVSEQARAVRPGIKISAAVFPNWNTDRDTIAQDWKLWCEKGYMDFVCPMDYTPSNASFENMVRKQVAWAGRVPCYPGIGLSATSPRLGIDRVIEQIAVSRRQKTGGFVIFNYALPESTDVVPMLGLGITAAGRQDR